MLDKPRTKMPIGTIATTYRKETCVICGHKPKKRAKGVYMALDYLYGVTLVGPGKLKGIPSFRMCGTWCLDCVQKLAGRLDTALAELSSGG